MAYTRLVHRSKFSGKRISRRSINVILRDEKADEVAMATAAAEPMRFPPITVTSECEFRLEFVNIPPL